MRWLTRLFVLALLAAGAWYGFQWYQGRETSRVREYKTAKVERGDLLITISATGTVEPEEVVDVGSQVAGQIISFGTDIAGKTIDYGSEIEKDIVLAEIDDSLYRADLRATTAQLAQANASVTRAHADVTQLKARLAQAEADWNRSEQLQKLGTTDLLTQVEVDTYKAAYESAKAGVAVGEAGIIQAQGSVAQAEASLFRAQRNLGFCIIKSPVKGIIIDRRVNIGQTVVASLNAPSLFLIAKDLKRMEVWVAVNEADIGQVHPGQNVTFTVDAFGGESFKGEVGKVRLNASMTQNVVTYTVEVTTDNSSGKLLPYLTANVKFEVTRREQALLVQNAALRFVPPQGQGPAAAAGRGRGPADDSSPRRAASRPATDGDAEDLPGTPGTVWVKDGASIRSVAVRIGVSDGVVTELLDGALAEGDEVIIGEQLASDPVPSQSPTNPFAPRMPSRGPGAGGRRGG